MIGKPLSILLPIDRLHKEHEIYDRLRKGERVHHFETKRVAKDKSIMVVSLTISPIKDKYGNITGLSKFVKDISEKNRKRFVKTALSVWLAMNLRPPLTSILAYLQILKAKARITEDDFSITALTKTETQAKTMISMVQKFLNIGGLKDGKMLLNEEFLDINSLI